ncbi:MAG: hypothetical protein P8X88_04700 [Gammaproteobacteria bacterium]
MSLLDKITGKKVSEEIILSDTDSQEVVGEVDYLWTKEDLNAKKPISKKYPRVDTGIPRNRIADKIAKMNNHVYR